MSLIGRITQWFNWIISNIRISTSSYSSKSNKMNKYNFILKNRPLSYNSCRGAKKQNYRIAIHTAFSVQNPVHSIFTGDIYATIYYFYNEDLDLDTDNLSKPVWDSLNGFLFNDDQQIKIRVAGSFNLVKDDYSILDFTGLDGDLLVDLLDAFDNEKHVVYIECGDFRHSMFKFNWS